MYFMHLYKETHIFKWIYRNLNRDNYQTHIPFTTSQVDFLLESGLYSSQEPALKTILQLQGSEHKQRKYI